jgi:hypothetical protein
MQAGLSIAPTTSSRQAQSLGQVKSLKVSPAIPPSPVELIYRGAVANPRVELLREALGLSLEPQSCRFWKHNRAASGRTA